MRLVELEGHEIVIRVPIDALTGAAEVAFKRHYGLDCHIEVVDADVFASEVMCELRKEAENGDTLVHLMLDKACVNAAEAGALGLSE